MIGRASIGYPWIFNEIKHYLKTGEHLAKPSLQERIDAVKQHLNMAVEWKGEKLGLLEMRPHYGNYFKSIPNFKEYRTQLVTRNNLEEVNEVFRLIERELLSNV